MYVHQLSQKEQDYIKARVTYFLTATGLEGDLLAEAIGYAMDSKVDDLEDAHGNTLYNNCVECEESWDIFEHLGIGDIHLDEIDWQNLRNHGQLYCICSDCGGNDESVLKEEN